MYENSKTSWEVLTYAKWNVHCARCFEGQSHKTVPVQRRTPGEKRNFPRSEWTGFSLIVELEPYMLKAY